MDTDERPKLQQSIRTNPFHRVIQECLVGTKEKLSIVKHEIIEETKDAENENRLNNMLRAEGLVGPPLEDKESESKNPEYHANLISVRKRFELDMKEFEAKRVAFRDDFKKILHTHGEFRPITHNASDIMIKRVDNDFTKVAIEIKQQACEEVIQLKKRFFDARRTRRNFSREATNILTDYFEANINHPYPSEETKHALAVKCNISVQQVCNWFGNKRIRYKKTKAEGKEKSVHNPQGPPMMPNPYGFGPNPYPMMMPFGAPQPNFPSFPPHLMTPCHFVKPEPPSESPSSEDSNGQNVAP